MKHIHQVQLARTLHTVQASCTACNWTTTANDPHAVARDHCIAYGHDVTVTTVTVETVALLAEMTVEVDR